jgi:glycosyltransferase involved in cell wall biosynthesis
MRIVGLFLNTTIRTGGHRRYLELLEGLATKGHEVITLMDEDLAYEPERFSRRAIAVYDKTGTRALPYSVLFLLAVRRNWRSLSEALDRADYIVIFGELHYLAARFLQKRLKARLFFAYRSNWIQRALLILKAGYESPLGAFRLRLEYLKFRAWEFLVARNAQLIAFQSESDRDDFLSRRPKAAGRTVVIRGDISEPHFKREFQGRNRSRSLQRLIYVGVLGLSKGIGYLLSALALLKERGIRDLSLDVLGRGENLAELEASCERLGLSGVVSFKGQVSDPFSYLERADLLVFPTLFDGYPNVVLEALHVGLPVIASRVGGLPDILRHDELLFPSMDAAAIADRIERCVRDPGFYLRIRELCAGRLEYFHFDWPGAWEGAMLEHLDKK